LVVKYHAGPEPISANLAYAGVFKASDDMDRTYAAAEPPTHDDWVFAQLEGHQRTFVRTTFVRIKERLTEFARPADIKSPSVQAPLGAASNFLGSLVAAATGSGAASAATTTAPGGDPDGPGEPGAEGNRAGSNGADPTRAAGAGPSRAPAGGRATVRLDGEPYFEEGVFGLLLVQNAVVVGSGRLVVRGTAGVTVADGTREQDPPEGSEEPTVIGWRIGSERTRGDVVTLENAVAGQRLALLVRPVPDTITQVDVAVVRGVEVVGHGR
jgi:hypothetical protein